MFFYQCLKQVVVSLQLIALLKCFHSIQATGYPRNKNPWRYELHLLRMVHFNCLLYMKIYCDPHFPVSLWLKCDPESPVVGLNWVSERKKVMLIAVKRWRCDYLRSMGANLRVFIIRKLSDERNYVHWFPICWTAHSVHYFNIFVFYLLIVEIQLSFFSFFKAGNLLFCLNGTKSFNCKYE